MKWKSHHIKLVEVTPLPDHENIQLLPDSYNENLYMLICIWECGYVNLYFDDFDDSYDFWMKLLMIRCSYSFYS